MDNLGTRTQTTNTPSIEIGSDSVGGNNNQVKTGGFKIQITGADGNTVPVNDVYEPDSSRFTSPTMKQDYDADRSWYESNNPDILKDFNKDSKSLKRHLANADDRQFIQNDYGVKSSKNEESIALNDNLYDDDEIENAWDSYTASKRVINGNESNENEISVSKSVSMDDETIIIDENNALDDDNILLDDDWRDTAGNLGLRPEIEQRGSSKVSRDDVKNKNLEVDDQVNKKRSFGEKAFLVAATVVGGVLGAVIGGFIGSLAGGVGGIPGIVAGAAIGVKAIAIVAGGATVGALAAGSGLGAAWARALEKPQGVHLQKAVDTLQEAGIKYTKDQAENFNDVSDAEWRHLLHIPKHKTNKAYRQQIRTALTHVVASDPLDGLEKAEALKKKLVGLVKDGNIKGFKEELYSLNPRLPAHFGHAPEIDLNDTISQAKIIEAFEQQPRDFSSKDLQFAYYFASHGHNRETIDFMEEVLDLQRLDLQTTEDFVYFLDKLSELRDQYIAAGGDKETNLSFKLRRDLMEMLQPDKLNAMKKDELRELQQGLTDTQNTLMGKAYQENVGLVWDNAGRMISSAQQDMRADEFDRNMKPIEELAPQVQPGGDLWNEVTNQVFSQSGDGTALLDRKVGNRQELVTDVIKVQVNDRFTKLLRQGKLDLNNMEQVKAAFTDELGSALYSVVSKLKYAEVKDPDLQGVFDRLGDYAKGLNKQD
ncbi:MAG: hypothetical protein AAGC81_11690 [Pseudomonadota bacterium]